MDQGFRRQIIVGRMMVIGGSPREACFAHSLIRNFMLQLAFRDKIADTARFFLVEIECFHGAHAVFVIVDRFRFGGTKRTA
ncbi:hypothetical protein PSYJA_20733 [Pseudomonas syringae pv. japonica str. M301072]|uniref:Uncharacterized protein n=1 Tax=Pseudomonas syringae pv. japonica str. M301072 TaxID=629262 RepID=F3FM36_PSESX|nr:hypothetical protein PSYJA_20733 [Pseudomonas syringae pv. japonica str. M301072]